MRPRFGPLPRCWPPPYPQHRSILASEARSLDRAAERSGLSALLLMEHAARGIAAVAVAMAPRAASRIAVVCGPGNNGGDGYAAARHLRAWGRLVRVVRVAAWPVSAAAGLEARLCRHGGPVVDASRDMGRLRRALSGCHLIVDAIFGVGLDRSLSAPFVQAIAHVNAAPALRLAVDVPSGMHADSGVPLPVCVLADATATMAAPKCGFAPGSQGARSAGRIVEIDIGLPRALHAPYLLRGSARGPRGTPASRRKR